MGKIIVMASGNGSNFQAIADSFRDLKTHDISALIYDRKNAYVKERAHKLNIPAFYVGYPGKTRQEAELEILEIVNEKQPDLIVLAGYMRLFTKTFIEPLTNKIINIHPALLPKHPGANGILDSYNSDDKELGITIHYVDEGMDTGPIIEQRRFIRNHSESLEEIEKKIHNLEHEAYPEVIRRLLDEINI